MNRLFSERYMYKEVETLKPDSMPDSLRNRLWNALVVFFVTLGLRNSNDKVVGIYMRIYDRFFKQRLDSLDFTNPLIGVRQQFFSMKWYEVYDFIEFIINDERIKSLIPDQIDYLINKVNQIFKEEGAPYAIINGCIMPLISEVEKFEIENVFTISDKFSAVKNHIFKACSLYSKRPQPDYLNSIKESISEVEALLRIILNNESASLGELVGQLNIHPALKEAIKKLYGWASDESGIRHSEKGTKFQVGQEEARFILVICCAFVNYIISKVCENKKWKSNENILASKKVR